jgi:hypothetical protein
MSTLHPHPSSQLAAVWLSRLHDLKTALKADPESFQAWHWRIQIRVLTFLISRYGDDPNCDWEREKQDDAPLVFDVESLNQEQNSALPLRRTIRRCLRRIEEANPDRLHRSPVARAPIRPRPVAHSTLADLENSFRGRPVLRWLPLVFLVLRGIFYLVVFLLLLAPWVWLLIYLANPFR